MKIKSPIGEFAFDLLKPHINEAWVEESANVQAGLMVLANALPEDQREFKNTVGLVQRYDSLQAVLRDKIDPKTLDAQLTHARQQIDTKQGVPNYIPPYMMIFSKLFVPRPVTDAALLAQASMRIMAMHDLDPEAQNLAEAKVFPNDPPELQTVQNAYNDFKKNYYDVMIAGGTPNPDIAVNKAVYKDVAVAGIHLAAQRLSKEYPDSSVMLLETLPESDRQPDLQQTAGIFENAQRNYQDLINKKGSDPGEPSAPSVPTSPKV